MAKRIQLVLNRDVSKLGKIGDLVDVAPGYARNYLIPQGLAAPTSPGILKQVARRKEIEQKRLQEEKEKSLIVKTALEKVARYGIAMQAGEEDVLFGTVTHQDVADVIQKSTGHEVDRRGITLPEIRKLGTYQAEIKLHPEVSATVEIEVTAA